MIVKVEAADWDSQEKREVLSNSRGNADFTVAILAVVPIAVSKAHAARRSFQLRANDETVNHCIGYTNIYTLVACSCPLQD